MKLLILGGTVFLGRHAVDAALARGHEVTLFNRGQHHPELFPGVTKLRGNRDGDLSALDGGRWDAVIDTSGHVPRVVRASAEKLAGVVGRYVFLSTVWVYRDFPAEVGLDEGRPLRRAADPLAEEITFKTLGPLKALCEAALDETLPGRAIHVRAGLVCGPHDPSGRFTYWPRRVAEGGEVLVPGAPETPVQVIDARDLAAWVVTMAEAGEAGAYNATGPDYPLTMGRLAEACRDACGGDARFTHVDEDFLIERGVKPWGLWIPRAPGAGAVDCRKAIAAGLAMRPITETALDTLTWKRGAEEGSKPSASGLPRDREDGLLREWHGARLAVR